ncbi:efflux RND transporter periplasmic adaptor subunit [Vibrio albus]|uniref:Efflux RND transporter periplasmic adaptor subunit n=1 Tax=Vibrio albus TaxID=2200953 RepID=A0A2U3B588_9VIBR|nr:efflux RND transporter periplasmic adaptor subunit [Vibrio albus]PWI31956.1 efflux RND transporter periplasmic adaptor subunit [Vibrio albus]
MFLQQRKFYGALIVTLAVLQGCESEETIRDKAPLSVTSYTVPHPVEKRFREFKGKVEPAELTNVSFRIGGELDAILVRSGQKVKRGELLALLNSDRSRQQLADAEVRYQLAQKQLNRGKELFTKKMISRSELDSLTANRRIAEVTYRQAQNQLEYARLVAPFDGVISSVPKKAFESVQTGEPILSMYQSDIVQIRVAISDAIQAMIDPDEKDRVYQPQVTFLNDDRHFYPRYLKHSSEQLPENQSYEFWLQMDQVEPPILPGTSASIRVDMVKAGLQKAHGYEVPMTVLDAGDSPEAFYVWKLSHGSVSKKVVEVERITEEGVIISDGVTKGEQLVNSGLRKLRDGMSVNYINEGSPQ